MTTRAKRNNNPGNIKYGTHAVIWGAVGKDDGGFAVFPNMRAGTIALVALLGGAAYGKLTLKDVISRYAPGNENDTEGYIRFVCRETGLAEDTVVGEHPAHLLKIAAAITLMEGWY